MKIVHISPLIEKVPPTKYGGVELIIFNLIEEMVKKGHEVYLFGTGDSQTNAKLVSFSEKSFREIYPNEEIWKWYNYYKISLVPKMINEINKIQPDIVFNHFGWTPIHFVDFIKSPFYTISHGNISLFEEIETYKDYKDANYISISYNQRKALPDINWVKNIYNGIDVDKFEVGTEERDYFVFLGRISPEKGIAEICKMIKSTNYKLKIAAKVDAADVKYFEEEIKPYIDGEQIEFLGEVDHEGKVNLLKGAKGLLLWLNWEEPFGLVVIEAMACGTPVIVNTRGSMPELIKNGETGFLVNTLDEFQASLDKVDQINPSDCRKHVEQNFSSSKMADDYLSLI